jgi:DNA-3-methyladenine glycosylase I
LKKRVAFQKAFDNFDFNLIAGYNEDKIQELLKNEGIIRNRLKIIATVNNAQRFVEVRKEFGTFDRYVWQFTGFKTIDNRLTSLSQMQSRSPESDAMSRDLKKRGFRFAGSTICYAFMQASGMVNDHLTLCFRYKELTG